MNSGEAILAATKKKEGVGIYIHFLGDEKSSDIKRKMNSKHSEDVYIYIPK